MDEAAKQCIWDMVVVNAKGGEMAERAEDVLWDVDHQIVAWVFLDTAQMQALQALRLMLGQEVQYTDNLISDLTNAAQG